MVSDNIKRHQATHSLKAASHERSQLATLQPETPGQEPKASYRTSQQLLFDTSNIYLILIYRHFSMFAGKWIQLHTGRCVSRSCQQLSLSTYLRQRQLYYWILYLSIFHREAWRAACGFLYIMCNNRDVLPDVDVCLLSHHWKLCFKHRNFLLQPRILVMVLLTALLP